MILDAFLVTSDPARPMETPISALLTAGASFTLLIIELLLTRHQS
jgi:hypothetical protein